MSLWLISIIFLVIFGGILLCTENTTRWPRIWGSIFIICSAVVSYHYGTGKVVAGHFVSANRAYVYEGTIRTNTDTSVVVLRKGPNKWLAVRGVKLPKETMVGDSVALNRWTGRWIHLSNRDYLLPEFDFGYDDVEKKIIDDE